MSSLLFFQKKNIKLRFSEPYHLVLKYYKNSYYKSNLRNNYLLFYHDLNKHNIIKLCDSPDTYSKRSTSLCVFSPTDN